MAARIQEAGRHHQSQKLKLLELRAAVGLTSRYYRMWCQRSLVPVKHCAGVCRALGCMDNCPATPICPMFPTRSGPSSLHT